MGLTFGYGPATDENEAIKLIQNAYDLGFTSALSCKSVRNNLSLTSIKTCPKLQGCLLGFIFKKSVKRLRKFKS